MDDKNPNEFLQDLIELVGTIPNDQQLGGAVRELLKEFTNEKD
jgi:hypothetical protein